MWGAADEGVLRRINSLELLGIFKIQKTAIDVPGEVKTRTLHQMQMHDRDAALKVFPSSGHRPYCGVVASLAEFDLSFSHLSLQEIT